MGLIDSLMQALSTSMYTPPDVVKTKDGYKLKKKRTVEDERKSVNQILNFTPAAIGSINPNVSKTMIDHVMSLIERGVHPEDLWNKTQHWKFGDKIFGHIDDSTASLNKLGSEKLNEILNHPKLFEKLPELNASKVRYNDALEGAGYYNGLNLFEINPKNPKLFEDLIHEVNHATTDLYNLPKIYKGTSENLLKSKKLLDAQPEMMDSLSNVMSSSNYSLNDDVIRRLSIRLNDLESKNLDAIAQEAYLGWPGEAMARAMELQSQWAKQGANISPEGALHAMGYPSSSLYWFLQNGQY